jgi:hypothetical protein
MRAIDRRHRRTVAAVRVMFLRHAEKRSAISWVAVCAKRRRVPGSYMAVGQDVPHDLLQYVVEAAEDYEHGFWGLVEHGATFKSTGRKRTKPGRAVIREHRDELNQAEVLPQRWGAAWRTGDRAGVAGLVDRAYRQWASLGPDEALAFEWPSPVGEVVSAAALRSA